MKGKCGTLVMSMEKGENKAMSMNEEKNTQPDEIHRKGKY